MQEHAFVLQARALVPEGCTIIEYAGSDPNGIDLRFRRIGELVGANKKNRFEVVPAFAPGTEPANGKNALEDVLRDPPACLYLYEGLPCLSEKNPDEDYARRCGELHRKLNVEVVSEMKTPLTLYDSQDTPPGKIREPWARFTLSRAPASTGP